jgi:hypothetical protein
MSTSVIPRIKAALFDQLTTLYAAQPKLQVIYGRPFTYVAGECVAITTVTSSQKAATIGALRRDENVRATVEIWVAVGGKNQRGSTERACVLGGMLEDYLRANPNLLNTVGIQWAYPTDLVLDETDPEWATQGRYARLTVVVTGVCRI